MKILLLGQWHCTCGISLCKCLRLARNL